MSKRDYSQGKIYCIRNNITEDIYVGSTCERLLSKRMVKHRSSMKNERDKHTKLYQKMNEVGVEHFYIELLHNFPCANHDELTAEEGRCIREITTLNGRVEKRTYAEWKADNRQHVKETQQKHYQENKEKVLERVKDYREANREISLQQHKEHYQQHKEEYAEKTKRDREQNKEKIAQRKKEYYERNKEKIAQQSRKYNQQNKDNISERHKEYYQQHSEDIKQRQREYRQQAKEEQDQ